MQVTGDPLNHRILFGVACIGKIGLHAQYEINVFGVYFFGEEASIGPQLADNANIIIKFGDYLMKSGHDGRTCCRFGEGSDAEGLHLLDRMKMTADRQERREFSIAAGTAWHASQ
jgi:hypothetical protein